MKYIKAHNLLPYKCLASDGRLMPWLAAACLIIFISICGCHTCSKTSPAQRSNICSAHLQRKGNPALIFDMPVYAHRKPTISAEQFIRCDWPVSRQAEGYVNYGEIVTYGEYYRDEQYINSSNTPRQNFRRQVTGYRWGALAR